MVRGTLEVLVVNANGLKKTDILSKMDPYVILTCRTQEHKSSVAKGAGSNPEWNESFLFTIADGASELRLKIMDKDTFSKDDLVGEVTIPLETVLNERSHPPTGYNVVKNEKSRGEIRVGLTFFPEP